ncbi:hypothetical protein B0O99DRAFT_282966 [Bisporella sp. PMI_857]|nr:hypothetical protein B0O99DRAFT_282966 [Bisporella sp. PMI_857]
MVELPLYLVWLVATTCGLLVPGVRSQIQVDAPNGPPATPTQPHFTFDELYNLQTKFYDNFLWPADVKQAQSINSTLLAENVKGRIDITRTFEGRELNTEYLFGLFANSADHPEVISLIGVPVSYEFLHFTANQYITSVAARLQFNFTSLGLVVPVEIDSWNTYNENGEITQFDVTFRYWEWLVDYIVTASAPRLGATSKEDALLKLQAAVAHGACITHGTYCNGTNQQYADYSTCFSYLTQDIRLGQAFELGRNTLFCRSVHQNMIPYRPEVHCPHIGPSGGGMCTDDETYVSTVGANIFPIPYIPYGYSNHSESS